jgi:2Fe-2S type ferredoxin
MVSVTMGAISYLTIGRPHVLPIRRARSRTVVVHAEDGFCRDKVATPIERADGVEGESTLVFLGAKGQQVEVQAQRDTYILDSGLDAGLELPFTCRGGICGACVGKVIEGEVDQSDVADLSFTVSEEEQADGMTLLCMARPVSDKVVIETQSDWGYSLGIAEWQGATGEMLGKKVEPLMGKKWGE